MTADLEVTDDASRKSTNQLVKGSTVQPTMFTFQPLLDPQIGSSASQSILELDGGVKILVDVGWDDTFDVRQLAELEK